MQNSDIDRLKKLGSGYLLIEEMKRLSSDASQGSEEASLILESMVQECTDPGYFEKNRAYCSSILNALAHSRTSRSMNELLKFVRKLPESMPYGAVDLIAGLLPLYRKIIIAPLREMVQNDTSEIVRAIGLQTLCNMYMDGLLNSEDARFLKKILDTFSGDSYLTAPLAELTRIALSNISFEYHDEEIFDDLLVEM
jgi:hypothetical protein